MLFALFKKYYSFVTAVKFQGGTGVGVCINLPFIDALHCFHFPWVLVPYFAVHFATYLVHGDPSSASPIWKRSQCPWAASPSSWYPLLVPVCWELRIEEWGTVSVSGGGGLGLAWHVGSGGGHSPWRAEGVAASTSLGGRDRRWFGTEVPELVLVAAFCSEVGTELLLREGGRCQAPAVAAEHPGLSGYVLVLVWCGAVTVSHTLPGGDGGGSTWRLSAQWLTQLQFAHAVASALAFGAHRPVEPGC